MNFSINGNGNLDVVNGNLDDVSGNLGPIIGKLGAMKNRKLLLFILSV